MVTYDTLTDALNGLKKRGYSHEFRLNDKGIVDEDAGVTLAPDQFEIVEVYRFEGMSNPD